MPKELLITQPFEVTLSPYDDRPLHKGEVRAEAILSAISHGTELSLYRGSSAFHERFFDRELRLFRPSENTPAYPTRLGYEWVGRVNEVSAGVRGLAVGDLVHLPLPHCQSHTFSEHAFVEQGAVKLEPTLTPERAALLESTGIALQAVHDARIKVGDGVVIFGLGALGLLALQLARRSGASWVVGVDPLLERRTLGQRLGANQTLDPLTQDVGLLLKGQGGADVAIEFSGVYAALHEAIRSVRVGGLVVAAGFYQGGAAPLRLGEEWHHNRVSMVSSQRGWGNAHRDHPLWNRARLRGTAATLLETDELSTDALITHRFPFERAGEAFGLIHTAPETTLKVVLIYGTEQAR